jgi:hypothetical protein
MKRYEMAFDERYIFRDYSGADRIMAGQNHEGMDDELSSGSWPPFYDSVQP